MKKENNTKERLLNAFDLSENKQIAESCRIAGVSVSTYFFHYYKNADFRRQILEKQIQHLNEKLTAV
jgi:hypothetical protein